MAQYIEDFLPPIQSAGLNTLENASIGGTLAVTGNATFSGRKNYKQVLQFKMCSEG
jgi:hypothetical protein